MVQGGSLARGRGLRSCRWSKNKSVKIRMISNALYILPTQAVSTSLMSKQWPINGFFIQTSIILLCIMNTYICMYIIYQKNLKEKHSNQVKICQNFFLYSSQMSNQLCIKYNRLHLYNIICLYLIYY